MCLIFHFLPGLISALVLYAIIYQFLYFLLCFQAGIDKTRLAIVLESEAAYIFCKELPVEKFEDGSNNIDVFSPGQRYLVLNADGKSQVTAS